MVKDIKPPSSLVLPEMLSLKLKVNGLNVRKLKEMLKERQTIFTCRGNRDGLSLAVPYGIQ